MREVIRNASLVSFLPPEERLIDGLEELALVVKGVRAVWLKIVLTMGTWDMLHIGHERYLAKARQEGDILIVGIDDDEKTHARKGQHRPVVPEGERFEMLAHSRYVDLAMLKTHTMERWQMITVTRPDVLVVVEGTYSEAELAEIQPFCGRVMVLPRQAETSTSAKLRRLVLGGEMYQSLEDGKESS